MCVCQPRILFNRAPALPCFFFVFEIIHLVMLYLALASFRRFSNEFSQTSRSKLAVPFVISLPDHHHVPWVFRINKAGLVLANSQPKKNFRTGQTISRGLWHRTGLKPEPSSSSLGLGSRCSVSADCLLLYLPPCWF